MAEREQSNRIAFAQNGQMADIRHRDELVAAQREAARGAFLSDRLGQLLGGAVAISSLAAGAYTAYLGVYWAIPVAFVSLPIAAIIKAIRSVPSKVD
jgi:uncharacterized membrane protein